MVLQMLQQDFVVDDHPGHRDPRKMLASRLELNVHMITASIQEHNALLGAVNQAQQRSLLTARHRLLIQLDQALSSSSPEQAFHDPPRQAAVGQPMERRADEFFHDLLVAEEQKTAGARRIPCP